MSITFGPELIAVMQDALIQIYLNSTENVVAQISTSFESSAQDVFQSLAEDYATTRTAELVTQLDDSTKDMLRSDLKSYMEQGLTPTEIAQKLQDNYAFSDSRAMNIARTETGFTWNNAGISTIQLGGSKGVKVFDGDYDKECAEANGENWTFEYAFEHLLEHPQCVRSFGIMLDNEEFDKGQEDMLS